MTNNEVHAAATIPIQRRLSFDLLRIISICGVVAIHVFGPTAANQNIHGSGSWWAALIFSHAFIWAVPVFVMLSGALTLTSRAHSGGPVRFLAKRAKRILPALIFWHLVYLIGIRMMLLRQDFGALEVAQMFLDATVYPHLYFLWLIAGLYAVAPMIAAFLRDGGEPRARAVAIVSLGFTLLVFMTPGIVGLLGGSRPIPLGALTIWIAYIGYFAAGYALRNVSLRPPWLVAGIVVAGIFGTITVLEVALPNSLVVLRAVAPPEYLGTVVAALSICIFVVGISAFDSWHPNERLRRIIVLLSEASFGVFLVHLVVQFIPLAIFDGFRTQNSLAQSIAGYVITLVLSYTIAIAARRIRWVRSVF